MAANTTSNRKQEKPGARRPTLATVAREAGVAVSTVSAVLRGEKTSWSSKETRQRIFAAARKLQYRPNQIARALRAQESKLIGLAFHSLDMHTFPMSKLAEVERRIVEAGYQVLVRTHHGAGGTELRQRLMDYLSYQVAGIILMPSHEAESQVQWLASTGIPAVTLDAPNASYWPNVTIDRCQGAYLQVKHLIEDVGCGRLAFLVPGRRGSPADPAFQKMAGYMQALEDCGSNPDDHIFLCHNVDSGFAFGRAATLALLQSGERFDGVVTTSDQVAMSAMHTLEHAGRRIPQDVAIVGYDDQAFAAQLAVPLTTIRQPKGVGRIAVEMLLDQIAHADNTGPRSAPPENRILSPELIVRASTLPQDSSDMQQSEVVEQLHASLTDSLNRKRSDRGNDASYFRQ